MHSGPVRTLTPIRFAPELRLVEGAPSAPVRPGAWRDRARTLAWLLGVVPFLVLAARHWGLGAPPEAGDYAQYLSHARALLDGRPYGDIGYIYTAYNPYIGPPLYPPGLPLTLVPVLWIAGASDAALSAVMIATALAFLALAGRYLARREGPWVAAGAVLLTGIAVELRYASTHVMADVGFAALVWGVILLADTPGAWSVRRVAAITALGGLAMAYRAAGVPLVPAMACFALLRRRELGARPLIPVGVWVAVGLCAALFMPSVGAMAQLAAADAPTVAARAAANAYAYRLTLFELELYPFATLSIDAAYHIAATLLVVLGGVLWLRGGSRRFLTVFAPAYTLMLLVIPSRDARFFWPLFPLFAALLCMGLGAALRRLARARIAYRAPTVATATVALVAAITTARHLVQPQPVSLLRRAEVRDVMAWLASASGRADVRALFVNPRLLTWRTGIPAMGPFDAPPAAVVAELQSKRVTHVVDGDLGLAPREERALHDAIVAYAPSFTKEHESGTLVVYRFVAAP